MISSHFQFCGTREARSWRVCIHINLFWVVTRQDKHYAHASANIPRKMNQIETHVAGTGGRTKESVEETNDSFITS